MKCECSGSGAPTSFNGQRGQIVHLLDAEEVKSTAPSHAHSTLRGKSSLEELSLGATSSPWGEENVLNATDGLTGTVVVASVPLGLSGGGIGLNILHAGADDLEELELPVGVSSEGLDDGLLVVPLVINILVGWIVVADTSVSLDFREEFLDSRNDSGPVLVLKGGNESIGVVGQFLIWREARVDIGTDIDTEGSVEDTGLEVCDGSGGDSGVLGKNESFSNNGEHFHGQESLKIIYYYNSDESNRRHMWQLARIAYIIL